MVDLAKLVVRLEAQSSKLTSSLDKAERRSKRWERKTKKNILGVKSAFAGLGVGIAAIRFTQFIARTSKAADTLAKTSDKLGITTEALAGMRHAAELSGVASNTLDMAIQRMTRRLSEAAQGTGEAKGALKELGLEAKELAALSPDKAFKKIAGAMAEVTTQGDRVRLSFKLFDSEGVALVNTLKLGEAGLMAAAKEANALGLAISRTDAKKIEDANDAVTRLRAVVTGTGNLIATELSTPFTIVADQIVDAAIENEGFRESISGMTRDFVTGLGKALKVLGKTVNFLSTHPTTGSLGILGLAFLGTKGLAAGAIIGAVYDDLNRKYRGKTAQEAAFKRISQAIETAEERAISFEARIDLGQKNKLIDFFGLSPNLDALLKNTNKELVVLRFRQAEIRAEMQSQTGVWESFQNDIEKSEVKAAGLGATLITLGETLSNFKPEEIIIDIDEDDDSAAILAQKEAEENAVKLLKIEEKMQEKRVELELRASKQINNIKGSLAQNAINFLIAFGVKSKALALAQIVLTKTIAIAQTLAHTQTAAVLAYASQLVPGDPTSFARAAAAYTSTQALGKASAVLIGLGGVAEAANLSGGADDISSGTLSGGAIDSVGGDVFGVNNQRQDSPTNININITGGIADRDTAETIADSLREYLRDGGRSIA